MVQRAMTFPSVWLSPILNAPCLNFGAETGKLSLLINKRKEIVGPLKSSRIFFPLGSYCNYLNNYCLNSAAASLIVIRVSPSVKKFPLHSTLPLNNSAFGTNGALGSGITFLWKLTSWSGVLLQGNWPKSEWNTESIYQFSLYYPFRRGWRT